MSATHRRPSRFARLLVLAAAACVAPTAAHTAPAPPAAEDRDRDLGSIDGILDRLYGAISGPAGPRDWDAFRTLFAPGARLIPTVRRPGEPAAARVLTPDEFVEASAPRLKEEGFFEREVARRVDRFGAMAHVFSTYESRHAKDDAKPFSRGINSIQLLDDGRRWWVVTIFWDAERAGTTIPPEYLPRQE
ncbi:hypothetical protein OJF2_34220 [Aquisphaera giovannonii]|uniref:DUF4440 domain-containing protein n=1 Tax=Aquisphaera giovannonii TaxID=406548 RepID=A0A5B9W3Q1_9BACT|nr:hypothetical protein [Aquisphaera giovannonii]QEH34877.1 hypothetical protein OJF2_34220 [Aquisphaera giovannonii]